MWRGQSEMQFTYDETASPEAFCGALKTARERRGISLQSIADSTKIGIGFLTALERGDLRHWPKGIFRRSFFRDYAKAIGVPVESGLEAFKRLFPDGTEPPETISTSAAAPDPGPSLRLVTTSDQPAAAVEEDDNRLRITLEVPPAIAAGGWRAVLVVLADSIIQWATGLKARLGVPGVPHEPLAGDPKATQVLPFEEKARAVEARRANENAPAVRVRIHLPRSIRMRERRARVSGASSARPRY